MRGVFSRPSVFRHLLEVIMSRPDFDRVRLSSIPAGLHDLLLTIEGQSHPWLVGYLQNVAQRVQGLLEERDRLNGELKNVYRRLAKLERCNHAS
jgi:hypothetical protein